MMRPLAVLIHALVLGTVLDLSEATARPVTRMARALINRRLEKHVLEFRADLENMLAKYDAPKPHRSDGTSLFPAWTTMPPAIFILDRLLVNEPDEEACRFAAILIFLVSNSLPVKKREELACEFFRRALGRQVKGVVPVALLLLGQHDHSEHVFKEFVSALHIKEARSVFRLCSILKEANIGKLDYRAVGLLHYYMLLRPDTRQFYLTVEDPTQALFIVNVFQAWDLTCERIYPGVHPSIFLPSGDHDEEDLHYGWAMRCLIPATGSDSVENRDLIARIMARLVAVGSSHLDYYPGVLESLLVCQNSPPLDELWFLLVRGLTYPSFPMRTLAEPLFDVIAEHSDLRYMNADLRLTIAALWGMLGRNAQRLALATFPQLKRCNWPAQEELTTDDKDLISRSLVNRCPLCRNYLFARDGPGEYDPQNADILFRTLHRTKMPYFAIYAPEEENQLPFLLTKLPSDGSLCCSACAVKTTEGGIFSAPIKKTITESTGGDSGSTADWRTRC